MVSGAVANYAIDVGAFTNNKMEGTTWGSNYGLLAGSLLFVNGPITGNTWNDDPSVVFGATAAVPIFRIQGYNYGFNNRFHSARGNGLFMWNQTGGAIPAGAAVLDNAGAASPVVMLYKDGSPFAGLTTAASNGSSNGSSVGVVTEADGFQPAYGVGAIKANASQACATGAPVFATTGGVACGLDQTGAIGTVSQDLGSTMTIDLDPSHKGGATGASVGLTATGTTQGTGTVPSSLSVYSTVANGAGATLGIIPIGSSETICNDGASTLTMWPQSGASIHPLAADVSFPIPSGSCTTFRRTSMTAWH